MNVANRQAHAKTNEVRVLLRMRRHSAGAPSIAALQDGPSIDGARFVTRKIVHSVVYATQKEFIGQAAYRKGAHHKLTLRRPHATIISSKQYEARTI